MYFYRANVDIPADLKAKFGQDGLIQLFMCCLDTCDTAEAYSNSQVVRHVAANVAGSLNSSNTLFPAKAIKEWQEFDDFPQFDELQVKFLQTNNTKNNNTDNNKQAT